MKSHDPFRLCLLISLIRTSDGRTAGWTRADPPIWITSNWWEVDPVSLPPERVSTSFHQSTSLPDAANTRPPPIVH